MKARTAVAGSVMALAAVASAAAVPAFAATRWPSNGAGKTAAKAGSLATPVQNAITCTAASNKLTMRVSWGAITGATSYVITATGTGTHSGTVNAPTTIYDDTNSTNKPAAGTVYSYTVRAKVGTSWTSATSASASYTVSAGDGNC